MTSTTNQPKETPVRRKPIIKRVRASGAVIKQDNDEETLVQVPQIDNSPLENYHPQQKEPVTAPQTKRLVLSSIFKASSNLLIPDEYPSHSIMWIIKRVLEAFYSRVQKGPTHPSVVLQRDRIRNRVTEKYHQWKSLIKTIIQNATIIDNEINETYVSHIPSNTLLEKISTVLGQDEKQKKHPNKIPDIIRNHGAFQSENYTPIKKSIAYTMIDIAISYVIGNDTDRIVEEIYGAFGFLAHFNKYREFLTESLRNIEKLKRERQNILEQNLNETNYFKNIAIRHSALLAEYESSANKKTLEEQEMIAEELVKLADKMGEITEKKLLLEKRDNSLISAIEQLRRDIAQTPADVYLESSDEFHHGTPKPIMTTKYFCLPDYYPELDSRLYEVVSEYQGC
jgi:hypothetical protein